MIFLWFTFYLIVFFRFNKVDKIRSDTEILNASNKSSESLPKFFVLSVSEFLEVPL